jgi:hypothetical protein
MITTLPHTSDPIAGEYPAEREFRAWMEQVERQLQILTPEPVTTAQLEDEESEINTINKQQFRLAGNTTTGRLVYASGPDPSDTWLFMDGTLAHTPV